VSATILILRPQPGADATARRAIQAGLDPVVAPLFEVRALVWTAPDAAFDAVMLTSAHAARCGGAGLSAYRALPCHAVGEATAAAARAAGFQNVHTGPSDAASLAKAMAAADVRRGLHLCGADRLTIDDPPFEIIAVPVYSAEAAPDLPASASAALRNGALALLHSPRAAEHFATLCPCPRSEVRIAAISAAAAARAGTGWKSVDVAQAPRDEALLELAAKLCQTDRLC
jgi:uroporphyrinogen-III synthase